jgi:GT2 family glycosyltransferase
MAVVIPSGPGWQRFDVLARTLEGLDRQSVSGFETVVVVDDARTPPPGLARFGAVRALSAPHPGPGPRRNAGARSTERPLVLLLGDDTIPEPDLVARHVARHAAHPEPEVAVLGHIDWHPDAAGGRLQRWLDWSRTQFDFATIQGDEAGWGRFYSSNLSVKRDFLLGAGGFDEDFTFGYEDTELGLRLSERGLRLLYEPGARALHLHRYSWAALERRFELVGEGEFLMTRKHPEFPPYFLDRIRNRRRAPRWAPWPWLVDLVPPGDPRVPPAGWVPRLRRALEMRADSWYYARLTRPFLSGWSRAAARAAHSPAATAGRAR